MNRSWRDGRQVGGGEAGTETCAPAQFTVKLVAKGISLGKDAFAENHEYMCFENSDPLAV